MNTANTHYTTLQHLGGYGPVKVMEAKHELPEFDYLYFLSSCCEATAKGVEHGTGVVCRSCRAELPVAFGGAPPADKLDLYLEIHNGEA